MIGKIIVWPHAIAKGGNAPSSGDIPKRDDLLSTPEDVPLWPRSEPPPIQMIAGS